MSTSTKPPKFEEETNIGTHRGYAAKAILFNDEVHTFEEVATQLVKATRCSYAKGLTLANVVHHTGSAVVYSGHFERCEAVAMVLSGLWRVDGRRFVPVHAG